MSRLAQATRPARRAGPVVFSSRTAWVDCVLTHRACQAGRPVPGAGGAVAGQVERARDYAVPRRRSATASLVAMAVTLVVGLVAAGVTLPLVSGHAVRQYWWVLAVTPLAAACLYPPVIK